MNRTEILAFDATGQDDLEESYPAEIRFGQGAALACAGGNLRQLDRKVVPGGILDDFEVMFRLRKSLVTAPPVLGGSFFWRRQGETEWRGPLGLMRLTDPINGAAYTLYGGNPGQ